jgi:hypothetical protein
MTPREVSRRYSKGLDLEVVFKNGYKNSGMWAGQISRAWTVRRGEYIYTVQKQSSGLVVGCHTL